MGGGECGRARVRVCALARARWPAGASAQDRTRRRAHAACGSARALTCCCTSRCTGGARGRRKGWARTGSCLPPSCAAPCRAAARSLFCLPRTPADCAACRHPGRADPWSGKGARARARARLLCGLRRVLVCSCAGVACGARARGRANGPEPWAHACPYLMPGMPPCTISRSTSPTRAGSRVSHARKPLQCASIHPRKRTRTYANARPRRHQAPAPRPHARACARPLPDAHFLSSHPALFLPALPPSLFLRLGMYHESAQAPASNEARYVCAQVRVPVHIHITCIRIHTHTHTHTHTHALIPCSGIPLNSCTRNRTPFRD